MKRILFAAIQLLPSLFFAQSTDIKVALNENGIGYQFPECMRAGPVCELFPKDLKPKDSKINAYRTGSNSFIIEIKNDFLTEEKQLAILGKLRKDIVRNEEAKVKMETDLPVSTELLRALGIDPHLNTIKSGFYPIEIMENDILLKFELSSK